jgi:hypothetical protein
VGEVVVQPPYIYIYIFYYICINIYMHHIVDLPVGEVVIVQPPHLALALVPRPASSGPKWSNTDNGQSQRAGQGLNQDRHPKTTKV